MQKKQKQRSIIVSDLDLTLTCRSLMHAVAEHQFEAGLVRVRLEKIFSNIRNRYFNGDINYQDGSLQALTAWAQQLQGQAYDAVVSDTKKFLENRRELFYPYFKTLVEEFDATHDFYLVTANMPFVAEAVSRIFGLTGFASSQVEIKGGRISGELKNALAGNGGKRGAAQKIMAGYVWAGSIGLGDTENDEEMLKIVEHPVCVNPNPNLQKAAQKFSWPQATQETVIDVIKKRIKNDH